MSNRQRQGLYALYATAWMSGISFFTLKTWFHSEGPFGPVSHPLQFPALQLHGATAFLMMITAGFLLGSHVQQAWPRARKRKRGSTILAMTGILVITAYLLYYIVQEPFRAAIEYLHLVIGFLLPVALAAHVREKTARLREMNRN